jgi:hypothetical protein
MSEYLTRAMDGRHDIDRARFEGKNFFSIWPKNAIRTSCRSFKKNFVSALLTLLFFFPFWGLLVFATWIQTQMWLDSQNLCRRRKYWVAARSGKNECGRKKKVFDEVAAEKKRAAAS